MEIELVRPYGFCSGVKRIVGLIERLLREGERGRLYCLGQPIHNPGEVARLQAAGLQVLSELAELPEDGRGEPFLIRAHGLSPELKAEVERRGYEIVDGTCPLVLAAQRQARRLLEEGYRLVIVGHRGHPEVEGLRAVGGEEATVILEPEGLELEAKRGQSQRLGLLAQTTILPEQFAAVVAAAAPLSRELKVVNTLCPETMLRQEAVRRAAQRLELMLVIGGRNSSNTSRLAEIAARYTRCYHIEDQKELERRWFIGRSRIGISGGTSTPESSIRAVQGEILRLMGGVNDGEEDGRVCHGQ
ncbi:MAG: 4-hydroxy-3-methylbut-2-enyl diphosphate reductase [Candidatus Bipolaricaulia bacterium]